METNPKYAFLYSTRFWSMVIASASATLIDPSFDTQVWYVSLGKFLGLVSAGFVAVGSLDRVSDKKVEVAKIEASSAPVEVYSENLEVK